MTHFLNICRPILLTHVEVNSRWNFTMAISLLFVLFCIFFCLFLFSLNNLTIKHRVSFTSSILHGNYQIALDLFIWDSSTFASFDKVFSFMGLQAYGASKARNVKQKFIKFGTVKVLRKILPLVAKTTTTLGFTMSQFVSRQVCRKSKTLITLIASVRSVAYNRTNKNNDKIFKLYE